MKKLLVALGFALASVGAQAGNIYLAGPGSQLSDAVFDPVPNPALTLPAGSEFLTGTLVANHEGTFYATYLGSESGFVDFFMNGAAMLKEIAPNLGTTVSQFISGPSVVDFGFGTLNAGHASINNGDANTPDLGIGYLENKWGFADADGNVFDFLVGFNDDYAGHRDFDDMVMGVRYVATPLPAALPLLATGLALFGFSRRKSV